MFLGEDIKQKWWPARIVALWPNGPPQNPNGRGRRRGPYEVIFHPNGHAFLHRNQLKARDDPGFLDVEWGEVEERGDDTTDLKKADLQPLLPDLAKLLQGEYPGGQLRHNLFFGSIYDQTENLPLAIHYGAFTQADQDFVTKYLTDWIDGRLKVDCQPPAMSTWQTAEESRVADYVLLVLVPAALEILVITNEGSEIPALALQQLQNEGVDISHSGRVRAREHDLAIAEMKEAKAEEWYKEIYTARDMHRAGQNLHRRLKVSKKDLQSDSGSRARGARKDYKEK